MQSGLAMAGSADRGPRHGLADQNSLSGMESPSRARCARSHAPGIRSSMPVTAAASGSLLSIAADSSERASVPRSACSLSEQGQPGRMLGIERHVQPFNLAHAANVHASPRDAHLQGTGSV